LNVALMLSRSASVAPGAPALAHGEKVLLDYAGLWQRVTMLSQGLSQYAAPGDRIVMAMANSPDYLVLMFAALHRGLVLVPVNSALQVREVEHCIVDSGAVLCFTDADHLDGLRPLKDRIGSLKAVVDIDGPAFEEFICELDNSAPVERSAEDPAWIFYTSGTTGRPKGATLSHRNLRAMIAAQLCDYGTPPTGACLIHHAPLSHGSGLLAMSFVASGALQVIPEANHRDADGVLGLARHWGKASMFSAPTFLKRIVAAASADPAKAEGIHAIFFGGAPMYVEDLTRALGALGPRLSQMYGQGESPMTISGVPADAYTAADGDRLSRLMASVGWVRSGVEIAILDEAGAKVPDGQSGMVAVRGDVVMTGYWNMPEANAATLIKGWLHTGDIGILDEYGLLSLVDRAKDVIISGGLNIYPREVEEILLSHESVAEVTVVGIPDNEWGEVVVAAVVAHNDCAIDTDALDAMCLDNIARFKRPKKYVLMDELPKSAYGKILKREVISIISRRS
jgi:long-chain acyl-CoA synthetase